MVQLKEMMRHEDSSGWLHGLGLKRVESFDFSASWVELSMDSSVPVLT
jgi:hypothetical protein